VIWEISAWQASKTYKTNKNNFPKQIRRWESQKVSISRDDTLDKEVHKKEGEGLKRQRDTHVNLLLSKWVGIINLILLFLTQKFFLICAQKQRGKKLNSLQQTKGVSVHQMILLDYAWKFDSCTSNDFIRLCVNLIVIMKGPSEEAVTKQNSSGNHHPVGWKVKNAIK